MNAIEQCLEMLASATNTNTHSLNTVSESITNILTIIDRMQKRIEELESRIKELENATSPTGGSGAGHYGAGPWG